jgi:exonuclease III
MRVIFFNIWHGQVWGKLKKFLLKQASKTDIFCFLEVDPELEIKLEATLSNFNSVYHAGIRTVYLGGTLEGRSIFVSPKIDIERSEGLSLYHQTARDAGGLQFAELRVGDKHLLIGSLHGKALPGTKLDTPARLGQSRKLIDFFKEKEGPRIIGGDFNLLPDTQSLRAFRRAGYRDLIKEFGIRRTRNRLAWEFYKNRPDFVVQHHADYVFVSPEVRVKDFQVPSLEVSDHLPLILDFEV